MKPIPLLGCVLLLAGCSSTPAPIAVIDGSHPASASAPEGGGPPRILLRGEAMTRRTKELIAQREAQVDKPVGERTSSGGQIAKPDAGTNNPSSKGGHEHHE